MLVSDYHRSLFLAADALTAFRASGAVLVRMAYLHTFLNGDYLCEHRKGYYFTGSRLINVNKLGATTDIAIWSTTEMGLAISATSVAVVRPFFKGRGCIFNEPLSLEQRQRDTEDVDIYTQNSLTNATTVGTVNHANSTRTLLKPANSGTLCQAWLNLSTESHNISDNGVEVPRLAYSRDDKSAPQSEGNSGREMSWREFLNES